MILLVETEDTADSSSSSTRSSSSSKRTKRARIESPLRGSDFIGEESVLGCLKEDIDLSVQERNFELEKNWRELDMRMQERQAELDNKKEFMEMQRAMTESLKS